MSSPTDMLFELRSRVNIGGVRKAFVTLLSDPTTYLSKQ